jgi:methyltransferase-like protein/trans-aconitate methyltransferase
MATAYDTVRYPSYTHPQTHPDRLATIARLFGLKSAPVERCRVLELGCGNGTNLVPMAWALPDSEFVGIDLAAAPVAQGQAMIAELGLKNVRLVHGDLTGINETWGGFSYIIAHGIYSWVPAPVRERLLAVCHTCLAADGVVFVSYNAYPGGHLRQMMREMMRFHVRGCTSPDEQVSQALALIRFIADASPGDDDYRRWLREEAARVLTYEPGHLFHDDLAEINEPVYFTTFVSQARQHGLQFLGEADYFEASEHHFTAETRQAFDQLGRNRILREQYRDFLTCRRFRQTLLCHADVTLRTEPDVAVVDEMFVAAPIEPAAGAINLSSGARAEFETPRGARIETDYALGKAALIILRDRWPIPVPVRELAKLACARLHGEDRPGTETGADAIAALGGFLLQLFGAGAVTFRTTVPRIQSVAGERPQASPVVRWQIARGNVVTSAYHLAIHIEDESGRRLIQLLDGTRDRSALGAEMYDFLNEKGALNPAAGGPEVLRRLVNAEVESNLAKLARLGLLVRKSA